MDEIKVIAFDIDGTLYPELRLHVRMFGHFLLHMRFFYHFVRIRQMLRRTAPLPDLFHYQAILMSERIHTTTPEAEKMLQDIVYDGLAKYFLTIKPFKGVYETIKTLHESGYRIALLSDFPPEQKGNLWGIIPFCEKLLSSEKIGALKPSKYPFGILAQEMKVKPSQVLYVGNSIRCDVKGAKAAGMKTAYFEPFWRRLLHLHVKEADVSFRNYREFLRKVQGNETDKGISKK